jgi:galactonate dehydratase
LLGGAKFDALPAYATGGPANYPLQELAAKMDFYLSKGFRAFKFATGAYYKDSAWHAPSTPEENADFEAKKMEFVRKHVGNDVGVMLDAHMGNSPTATWELPTALAVAKALEPFNLIFLEEPLHYTNPEGYAELCRQTKTTIAGGECLTGDYEWRMYVERDCFDLGQPDASFTGSLSQFMTIAKMLEKRDRKIATHAWGAGGSLMQNVHCGFAAANLEILEIAPAYGPLHSEIIGDSLVMKDGKVLVPTAPGLGIKLTEETKRKYPFQRGSGEWNSVPGKILPEDAR